MRMNPLEVIRQVNIDKYINKLASSSGTVLAVSVYLWQKPDLCLTQIQRIAVIEITLLVLTFVFEQKTNHQKSNPVE